MSDTKFPNIMAQARHLAKTEYLLGVCFLDKDGRIGAHGDAVRSVQLEFDSTTITLTLQEFSSLRGVRFNLRESEQP